MLVPIPQFTAPSYGDETLNNVQLCSNLYPVQTPNGWVLKATPGYIDTGIIHATRAFRGVYYSTTGETFCVCYDTMFKILGFAGGVVSVTNRGTVGANTSPAYMADNGTTLLMVDGSGSSYTMNMAAGAPALIVDANMPTAKHCAYHDGYFVVPKVGTGEFYLSNLLSGATWTPVAFATAEAKGDNLTAIYSNGSILQLLGVQSAEGWIDTGNASFPFERISGSVTPVGCERLECSASIDGVVYFLAGGLNGAGSVWKLEGTICTKISTPYIEEILVPGVVTDCFAFCYKYGGHSFFQLTNTASFPGTFVYNITNGTWFQKSGLGSTPDKLRFVLNVSKADYSTDTIGFYGGSVAYIVSISSATNSEDTAAAVAITRRRVFGPIESNTKKLFHYHIRIEADIFWDAIGSTTISGVLDWTDNNGLSYSSGLTLTATVIGSIAGAQRAVWVANRLGSSACRYYRWTMAGPAAQIILKKCELDLQEGRF